MAVTTYDPEFDRARAQVYDLLSAVFDGDMVVFERALQDRAFDELASALSADLDVPTLAGQELDRSALEFGYDTLFEVPGSHHVPPFASAYVDEPTESYDSSSTHHEGGEAGELYGEPAARMADRFERVGYSPDLGEGIPDHVAAQLGFMAALSRTKYRLSVEGTDEPITPEAIRTIATEALTDLDWLERFAKAVAATDASVGAFARLAAFTVAFVRWDAAEHGIDWSDPA